MQGVINEASAGRPQPMPSSPRVQQSARSDDSFSTLVKTAASAKPGDGSVTAKDQASPAAENVHLSLASADKPVTAVPNPAVDDDAASGPPATVTLDPGVIAAATTATQLPVIAAAAVPAAKTEGLSKDHVDDGPDKDDVTSAASASLSAADAATIMIVAAPQSIAAAPPPDRTQAAAGSGSRTEPLAMSAAAIAASDPTAAAPSSKASGAPAPSTDASNDEDVVAGTSGGTVKKPSPAKLFAIAPAKSDLTATPSAPVAATASPPSGKGATATPAVPAEAPGSISAAQPASDPAIAKSAAPARDHAPDKAETAPAKADPLTPAVASTGSLAQQVAAPVNVVTSALPANVTVSAATALVPLSGLAVHIAAKAKDGESSFDIRLDPADLGRIDVKLHVDSAGNVTSHLTVERPETLAMLRQDAPQLQRALNDAGLTTSDSGLQFSLGDQSGSRQNTGNGQSSSSDGQPRWHRLVVAEDEALPSLANRNYGRVLTSRSGVDIRI